MVIANPPLAEPVIDPGGVTIKPPFEMGVANWNIVNFELRICYIQQNNGFSAYFDTLLHTHYIIQDFSFLSLLQENIIEKQE